MKQFGSLHPGRWMVFTLTILAFGLQQDAQAQYVNSAARLTQVPQHTDLFPGSRPKLKGWLGMTGLSGLTFRLDNTLLQPEGLFLPGPSGGTIVRLAPLMEQLTSPESMLGTSTSVELASFGFSGGEHGESIWSFRIRERLEADATLPGALFEIPFHGNPAGSVLDMSAFGLRAIHFREYSVGWNRAWGDFLNTGIRVNHLYGMEFAELTDFQAAWSTNATDFSYNLAASGAFRSSGLNTYGQTGDSLEHYLLYRDNRGWSMDAGLRLALSERATVGLHVVDLGQIHWREDLRTHELQPSTFAYQGPTLEGEDALDFFEGDSLGDWLAGEWARFDSAMVPVTSAEAFSSRLPTRLSVEGAYIFRDAAASQTSLHGAWTGRHAGGDFADWQANLGLRHEWDRKLGLNMAWNVFSAGFSSLGVGLALNLGMFQWYVAADNLVLTPWTRFELGDDVSFVLPNRAEVLSLQTGFNLVFGKKPLKEDKRQGPADRAQRRRNVPCEDFMAGGRR